MTTIHLENATQCATFDTRTGALVEYRHRPTGWRIQRRPELGLSFDMLLPLPDRRNNHVIGAAQAPPAVEHNAEAQAITFTWTGLRSEHGSEHDITFRGRVALTDFGLTFSGEIANHSAFDVETIAWPCIGDLSRPDGTVRMETAWMGYNQMARSELYPKFPNMKGGFGVDYPTQMIGSWVTPFFLVENGSEGLYIGFHDVEKAYMLQYVFQLKPGWVYADSIGNGTVPETDDLSGEPARTEFQAIHYPYVNAGEIGHLRDVVLAPYQGSWHAGVDVYKAWRETWYRPVPQPAWAREVHAWHQLHINSPEDELRCRYTDLVRYGEDAARHGVKAIQLVGWNDGGQDRGNPSHDTDPRLGTWQDLHDAIATIQAMGVQVILFTKYTWAERGSDWYRNELITYATKDPYGDPHYHVGYQYQTPTQLADINTRRFAPMCVCCAEWREIAFREFQKAIDLGAAGMLFDECFHHGICGTDVTYCFDPSHGHHVPAFIYAGDPALEAGFRAIAEAQAPDFFFSGEGVTDFQFLTYQLSYFRTFDLNAIPVHRYIDADIGLMMAVSGHNDRNNVNLALMHKYIISHEPRNFKGRLDEYPATLAYAKAMDALRTRYREYLWDADFRHTLGAAVTANGEPHADYSVFVSRATGKRAVVVSNFDLQQEKTIEVTLDDAPDATFVLVTPEAPDPVPAPTTIALAPLSAFVVLEQSAREES